LHKVTSGSKVLRVTAWRQRPRTAILVHAPPPRTGGRHHPNRHGGREAAVLWI